MEMTLLQVLFPQSACVLLVCILQLPLPDTECRSPNGIIHRLLPEPHLRQCFSIILGLGTAAHLQHIAQKYIHGRKTLQINHLLCYSCITAPHADWGAKKAEFSMLNAQRWSGWIDSYAMAIFDIFQPNWNLFDYPNKVQIASSRSITTTGNG